MELIQQIEDLINVQKYDEALSLLEQCKEQFENKSEFFNVQAVLYYYSNQLEKAESSARNAIVIDDTNLDAHKNLIDILRACLQVSNNNNVVIICDTQNKEVPVAGNSLYESRELVMQALMGQDDPLVDIVVLGYNRLEKTKRCVNSIIQYTTGIDYQLILVNSGSSDETLSYFQSVNHPRKKIVHITKNLGSMFASMQAMPYMHAPYRVVVANDVYVTTNWLSNLLQCAKSNPDAGMICPMSSNTSNLQDPGLRYESYLDMQAKAVLFNQPDENKWEERMRLMTPCTLYTKIAMDIVGIPDYGFFHDFSDDDYSFRVRRSGYKTILCADTFVCHDHDFSANENKDKKIFEKSLQVGKENFYSKQFVDAWDDVNNFERSLISTFDLMTDMPKKLTVLGIDVKCGTPLLELKNRFRRAGFHDVSLAAYTSDAKYYCDLKTICRNGVEVGPYMSVDSAYFNMQFDCIIVGKAINSYADTRKFLEKIAGMLRPSGRLLLKVQNMDNIECVLRMLGSEAAKIEDNIHTYSFNKAVEELNAVGLTVTKSNSEMQQVSDESIDKLRMIFAGIQDKENRDRLISNLLVINYNFHAMKANVK